MSREVVFKKLDEMYRGEKSKKFLTHMILAYFPQNKVEKVVERPQGRFKCAITGTSLLSGTDVAQISESKEYFDGMMQNIQEGLSGKTMTHPTVKMFGNRKMGLTSKDSDTFLSIPTYEIMFEWLVAKMLDGDKHINKLINDMTGNGMFIAKKPQTEIKMIDEKWVKKNRPIKTKKIKDTSTTPKSTLGDFSALQVLKEKMEKDEN